MPEAKIALQSSDFEELTSLDWHAVGGLFFTFNSKCRELFSIEQLSPDDISTLVSSALSFRQGIRKWTWLVGFLKFLDDEAEIDCNPKGLAALLEKLGSKKGVTAKSKFNELASAADQQNHHLGDRDEDDVPPVLIDALLCGVFLVISRWWFNGKPYFLVETLLIQQPGHESYFFACDDGVYFGKTVEVSRQIEVTTNGDTAWRNARSMKLAFDPDNEPLAAYFDGSKLRTFPKGKPQTSKAYVVRLPHDGTTGTPVVEAAEHFRTHGDRRASNRFTRRVRSGEGDFKKLERLYPKGETYPLPYWEVEEQLQHLSCLSVSEWDVLFNPNQLALPHLTVVQ